MDGEGEENCVLEYDGQSKPSQATNEKKSNITCLCF
jgi:hypothetical protein